MTAPAKNRLRIHGELPGSDLAAGSPIHRVIGTSWLPEHGLWLWISACDTYKHFSTAKPQRLSSGRLSGPMCSACWAPRVTDVTS